MRLDKNDAAHALKMEQEATRLMAEARLITQAMHDFLRDRLPIKVLDIVVKRGVEYRISKIDVSLWGREQMISASYYGHKKTKTGYHATMSYIGSPDGMEIVNLETTR